MIDFDIMMKAAQQLKDACRTLAKGMKAMENRMHAAFIMVDRAETVEELETGLVALRKIMGELRDKEFDYERTISDPPQSRRKASVRHSSKGGGGGHHRGDLDSLNVGSSGLSDRLVAPRESLPDDKGRKSDRRSPRRGPRVLSSKGKVRRGSKAELRFRGDIEGPDANQEVPKEGLKDD